MGHPGVWGGPSFHLRSLPWDSPHDRGGQCRLVTSLRCRDPHCRGARHIPRSTRTGHPKTAGGGRSLQHLRGRQDHYRPAYTDAPIAEVTLPESSECMEPDRCEGSILGPVAQNDATLALAPGPDVYTHQGS